MPPIDCKISSVKKHYATHLGPLQAWMAGGEDRAICAARAYLRETLGDNVLGNGIAVDLGAGIGAHSLALAEQGYNVFAIDYCPVATDHSRINPIQADIREFRHYIGVPAAVLLCLGDTLTHLPSLSAVLRLLEDAWKALACEGNLVLSFRDYFDQNDHCESRFVTVRSDTDRILTCHLSYRGSKVVVNDILHTREGDRWNLSVSAYEKLRIDPAWLLESLREKGFLVVRTTTDDMVHVLARRA